MRPMRKVACACQNCNVELRKFNFVVVFYTFWTQPAQKTRNAWCVAPDAASFIELSTHYFTCYFSFWHFSNKQKQRMRKDSIYLLMKRKRQSAVSFTFIIQLACVRTGSLFFIGNHSSVNHHYYFFFLMLQWSSHAFIYATIRREKNSSVNEVEFYKRKRLLK